ncbi:hypothetical protein L596_020756 [Steinernema carpocapsae]|uniref:Uncharacterized protein n=1 Tax=Steinernema carpocapsae TaxID=34508 RepID=A0A4U5MUG6_STECR|nr:hypothetical protein L596_020756 [Steinernema carpocapsae]
MAKPKPKMLQKVSSSVLSPLFERNCLEPIISALFLVIVVIAAMINVALAVDVNIKTTRIFLQFFSANRFL